MAQCHALQHTSLWENRYKKRTAYVAKPMNPADNEGHNHTAPLPSGLHPNSLPNEQRCILIPGVA